MGGRASRQLGCRPRVKKIKGGKSSSLNSVMKKLFNTMVELNVCLHLSYIRTNENPADEPPRRLSNIDCQLTEDMWQNIQNEFDGPGVIH